VRECSAAEGREAMLRLAGRPLPLSGAAWGEGLLRLRLAGASTAVRAAAREIGGELEPDTAWWRALRDQRLPFFRDAARLWRVSVPPAAPALGLPGEELIDWGGAQRWVRGEVQEAEVRGRAVALGGHATLLRGAQAGEAVFHPLAPGVHAIHRELKRAFDPKRILNPGRLYDDL